MGAQTVKTAIAVPMQDSMNLNRAFRPGFKRGSRLAVTITTITVIDAKGRGQEGSAADRATP